MGLIWQWFERLRKKALIVVIEAVAHILDRTAKGSVSFSFCSFAFSLAGLGLTVRDIKKDTKLAHINFIELVLALSQMIISSIDLFSVLFYPSWEPNLTSIYPLVFTLANFYVTLRSEPMEAHSTQQDTQSMISRIGGAETNTEIDSQIDPEAGQDNNGEPILNSLSEDIHNQTTLTAEAAPMQQAEQMMFNNEVMNGDNDMHAQPSHAGSMISLNTEITAATEGQEMEEANMCNNEVQNDISAEDIHALTNPYKG